VWVQARLNRRTGRQTGKPTVQSAQIEPKSQFWLVYPYKWSNISSVSIPAEDKERTTPLCNFPWLEPVPVSLCAFTWLIGRHFVDIWLRNNLFYLSLAQVEEDSKERLANPHSPGRHLFKFKWWMRI